MREVVSSPGRPLDPSSRAWAEERLGHDFSQVRVHADRGAAQSASSMGAAAYAVGNHIAFGPGRFDPTSRPGRHLLAHELSHTVQQAGRRPWLARSEETTVEVMTEESLYRTHPRYIDNLVEWVGMSHELNAMGLYPVKLRGHDRLLAIHFEWCDWGLPAAPFRAPPPSGFASREEAMAALAGQEGGPYSVWQGAGEILWPTVLSPATTPRIYEMVQPLPGLLAAEAGAIANEFTLMAATMATLGIFRLIAARLQSTTKAVDDLDELPPAGGSGGSQGSKPSQAAPKATASPAPPKSASGPGPQAPPKPRPADPSLANRPKPKYAAPKPGETPEQYYERTRGNAEPLDTLPPPARKARVESAKNQMKTAELQHRLADPDGVWTHYLTKNGYLPIMRTQRLKAGSGQANLGQGEGVRVLPGPFEEGAAIQKGRLHLDFKVTNPPVPGHVADFHYMGKGAMWKMPEGTPLPIEVLRVGYVDGSQAVRIGAGRWRLVTPSGTAREVDLDTLLALGERPTVGLKGAP